MHVSLYDSLDSTQMQSATARLPWQKAMQPRSGCSFLRRTISISREVNIASHWRPLVWSWKLRDWASNKVAFTLQWRSFWRPQTAVCASVSDRAPPHTHHVLCPLSCWFPTLPGNFAHPSLLDLGP